jgi:type II secretory ATPase GspE/PulE/Tfp pilus assembly ATPase PilB-like protein
MFVAGASFYALILIAQNIWALITPNTSDLTYQNQSKNNKRNIRNQLLLLGPSGSGKTALFYKLIARQDY